MDAKEIYYESLLTKMLFQKSSIKKIPLSGTFELSPVCNFDCRMCYVRKSPEEVKCHNRKMLNLEQWKKNSRPGRKCRNALLIAYRWRAFFMAGFLEIIHVSVKKRVFDIN